MNLTGELHSCFQSGRHLLTEIQHLLALPAILRCGRNTICYLVNVIPQHIPANLHRCNLIMQVLQSYKTKFPSGEQGPLSTASPPRYPSSSCLGKRSHPEEINGNRNLKEMLQVVTNQGTVKGKTHSQSAESFLTYFGFRHFYSTTYINISLAVKLGKITKNMNIALDRTMFPSSLVSFLASMTQEKDCQQFHYNSHHRTSNSSFQQVQIHLVQQHETAHASYIFWCPLTSWELLAKQLVQLQFIIFFNLCKCPNRN